MQHTTSLFFHRLYDISETFKLEEVCRESGLRYWSNSNKFVAAEQKQLFSVTYPYKFQCNACKRLFLKDRFSFLTSWIYITIFLLGVKTVSVNDWYKGKISTSTIHGKTVRPNVWKFNIDNVSIITLHIGFLTPLLFSPSKK